MQYLLAYCQHKVKVIVKAHLKGDKMFEMLEGKHEYSAIHVVTYAIS